MDNTTTTTTTGASTLSSSTLSPLEQFYAFFVNPVLVVQFYQFGYPFTFVLGFIGNISSLLTFSRPTLRKVSTGCLFIVLAISDLLYLFICIFDFLEFGLKVNIRDVHPIDSLFFTAGSILSSCGLFWTVSLSHFHDECRTDLLGLDLGHCLSRSMDSHTVSVQVGFDLYTEESTGGSGYNVDLGCRSKRPRPDTDVWHAHPGLCERSLWRHSIQSRIYVVLLLAMGFHSGKQIVGPTFSRWQRSWRCVL